METQANVANNISKSVVGALAPERLAGQQEKAANAKPKAGFDATAFGKAMAKDFMEFQIQAGKTWCNDVLKLVQECKDTDREAAMKAASEYAETIKDDAAKSSLRKRISEARRVFKAALTDFEGTVKILKSKAGWHSKVALMPIASNAGRKAGQGAGKSTKKQDTSAVADAAIQAGVTPIQVLSGMAPAEKIAEVNEILKVEALAKGAPVVQVAADGKVTKTMPTPIADALKQAEATEKNVPKHIVLRSEAEIGRDIAALSLKSKLLVLDNLLFQLSEQQQDLNVSAIAKLMLGIKDKHDQAELKKAAA